MEEILFKVPEAYKVTFERLLVLMSDYGEALIKDCSAGCEGKNVSLINQWNIFQSACAAYSLGEVKKANTLINYINAQLDLDIKHEIPAK